MSSRVDEQHTQQHDMASNTTSLGIVNLQGYLRTYLNPLDVEETVHVSYRQTLEAMIDKLDVMGSSMQNGEE